MGAFGLFTSADNAQFLINILHWLLSTEQTAIFQNDRIEGIKVECPISGFADYGPEWSRVESKGIGQHTIAAVERFLRRTGTLKALSRARWMP